MKIGLLTLNQSQYGKNILEEFRQRQIPVDSIFVVHNTTKRKLKLLQRVAKKLGWLEAIILTILRLTQSFTHPSEPVSYEKFSSNTFYFELLHSKESLKIIQDQAIDILILGQSGIIKEELINCIHIGAINAHPGILPYYRGLDCPLWAVFNEDRDKIGSTLHWVDTGIDTGRIIAQKKYEFQGQENIFNLEPQIMNDCVSLISDFIEQSPTKFPKDYNKQDNAKSDYTFKMPLGYLFKTSRKLKKIITH